ncbi:MAG: sensor histidine kinase [Oscillospiraceae bacterium]
MADKRLRKGKNVSSDKIMAMTDLASPKIRTALQRIMFCAGRLPESCSEESKEILENAYRILNVSTSFEEYFSIITGEYRLEKQLMEVSSFLEDLCGKLLPYMTERGIAFSFSIPKEQIVASLDRQRFQSALLNILKNSVKYTAPGNRIFLRATATKRYVKILIRDKGTGMYDEVLEHCCEPFFSRDGGEGMGFGLTLARYFVNESGGKLEIKSKLDSGTVVEMKLPLYHGGSENSEVSSYFGNRQEADPELIKAAFGDTE